jgi:hypothetical protein
MPDLESKLRAYAVRLDERYPDVTLDELTASPHAERSDQLAGPIDLASVVSAERGRTVTLSDAEPTSGTRNRRRLLIAAAAVVAVIGVAGFTLAATDDDNDQSPAPVATVSVAPTTAVATETVRFVVASANDIPVTFTVPKSWTVLTHDGAVLARPIGSAYSNLTHDGAVVQFDGVSNIYSGGCMTPLDPPVGPTVDDLVTAWANVPELAATAPVDITVDGYAGKQIEFTVPDDACGMDIITFGVWSSGEPNKNQRSVFPSNQPVSPKQHFQMFVLDVDGTRLLIAASTHPNTPPQEQAALEELLASIQIG